VHYVGVDWKSGRSSRVLLLDSDSTSRQKDGWKQLNTLAHYNIPSNSAFLAVNHRSTARSLDNADSPITRTVNGTKYSHTGGIKNTAIRLSVCLSHAPSSKR